MAMSGDGLIEVQRFRKSAKSFFLKINRNIIDFKQFLKNCTSNIILKLKELTERNVIKFNLHLLCTYENLITGEIRDISFKTSNILLYNSLDYKVILGNKYDKLLREQSFFFHQG